MSRVFESASDMRQVRPASPELECFARDTLGCNCPPEVFARVEYDPSGPPGLPEIRRRIAIGGRLLIYLVPIRGPAQAKARLGDWVSAGIAERDGRGMNRLRLVLGHGALAPADAQDLEAAFARLPTLDDRVHLHLLPVEHLAGL